MEEVVKPNIFQKIHQKNVKFWRIFKSLILVQLRDKVDFSWLSSRKKQIQHIVFAALKFLLFTGIIVGLLIAFDYLGIIVKSEMTDLYTVFFTLILVMILFSNTHDMMMSLYYSDGNKLLVTFPVSKSSLFFSKIIVYFVFDFIKNIGLLIPVTLGFTIGGVILGQIQWFALLWIWVPLFLASAIIVLASTLLSIPYIFIYKFSKAVPISQLIALILVSLAISVFVVYLISLIPSDIDLINQWPSMRLDIQKNIQTLCSYLYPFTFVVSCMFGKHVPSLQGYRLTSECFIQGAMLFTIFVALILIVFLIIKPFFFFMMPKAFEFEKNQIGEAKPNIKKKKYITFINKELKLSFRDLDISGSFILVYILTPILLYFMDSVFSAISTRLEGDIMTYAFNILLIALPYLSSNSMIATIYSKEGRAAYMKKTKPISIIFPLTSKLIFNFILSIISIVGCSFVFARFANIGIVCPILLGLSILFIQYGHIFFSATLDIMNPQNEVYETSGEEANNPNQSLATAVGFIISIAIALVSYLFLQESHLAHSNYIVGFIKILVVSMAIFGSFLLLFVLKVKAYYYDK